MDGDPHGLWILGISVAALLLGPAIHLLARRAPPTMAALDNFVLVAVVGLVALEILPGALHLAGLSAFIVLLLGALGPALADGPLHRLSRGTHGAALALGIVGMAIHSFTDGLALASAHAAGNHSHALEAAVIAHQLPVAVAVWWLIVPIPRLGWPGATVAMIGLALATVLGFELADASLGALAPAWLGLLQALFAGFLLHVIAHRSHPVGALTDGHSHGDHGDHSRHSDHSHHSGHSRDSRDSRDSRPIRLAASLGGLVGLGLLGLIASDVNHGGHDPGEAHGVLPDIFRLAYAAAPPIVTALGLALLVGRPLRQSLLRRRSPAAQSQETRPLAGAPRRRGRRAHVGLVEQLDLAAPWFTIGLLLAATLGPFLGVSPLAQIPPVLQVLVLAVLGVPVHVFAPSATPLVALLVAAGLNPGAALAFMLSGPATELGALGRSSHVRARASMAVAFVLVLTAGLLIDLWLPAHPLLAPAGDLALFTLAALLLASLVRQTPQQFLRRLWQPDLAQDHGHDHDHDHDHEAHEHEHRGPP